MVAVALESHGPIDAAAPEGPEPQSTRASAGDSGMDALLIVGGLYIDEIHLLPHFPPEDSSIRSVSFTRRRGGNAATNACVLAQLVSKRVLWVGAIPANGGDGAAQFGLDAMQRYGVDVSLHERVPDTEGKPALGMPTSVILASQASGSRTIVSSRRGLRETSPAWVCTHVLPSLPPRCWLHFEGREYQSVHEIMEAAHAARQRQPGWRLSVEVEKPAFTVAQLLAFAALADVCFISREWAEANVHALLDGGRLEAHDTGVPDDSHLAFQTLRALERRFKAAGSGGGGAAGATAGSPTAEAEGAAAQGSETRALRVVWFITWGDLGAFALECTRSGRGLEHRLTRAHFAPAEKVERVVDSTGAGDTFNGAVISTLSGCSVPGADAGEALRVGCRVAGRKVAQVGFDGLASALQTVRGPASDPSPRGLKRKAE